MVVRFVCVVCVPLCVRVSRVSRVRPGSPRCLFTGKHTPKRKSCARERERAFALLAFFVDVDVGVLAPVLLL
jgi:hypothetical protein